MSLNRSEQIVYDYLMAHVDERQHWQAKVRRSVADCAEIAEATRSLDSELWRYYVERSNVAPTFKEAARAWGLKRTSMKNLSELLVRLWTDPRPKKPSRPQSEII